MTTVLEDIVESVDQQIHDTIQGNDSFDNRNINSTCGLSPSGNINQLRDYIERQCHEGCKWSHTLYCEGFIDEINFEEWIFSNTIRSRNTKKNLKDSVKKLTSTLRNIQIKRILI